MPTNLKIEHLDYLCNECGNRHIEDCAVNCTIYTEITIYRESPDQEYEVSFTSYPDLEIEGGSTSHFRCRGCHSPLRDDRTENIITTDKELLECLKGGFVICQKKTLIT